MINIGARTRTVLMIITLVLPIAALTVYNGLAQRKQAEASEPYKLQLIANLIAPRHSQLIEGMRVLLEAIAVPMTPLLGDRRSCELYLERTMPKLRAFAAGAGVFRMDGTRLCGDLLRGEDAKAVSAHPAFRDAAASGQYRLGTYRSGAEEGSGALELAAPVFDTGGKLQAILVTGLQSQAFLAGMPALLDLQQPSHEERRISVIDRGNRVIAGFPSGKSRVGESVGTGVLMALQRAARGVFTARNAGGEALLYAVEPVAVAGDGSVPLRVLVSVPVDSVYAEIDRALWKTMIGIAVVAALILLLGSFIVDVFLMRRFRVLLHVAERVRQGDLSARTGLTVGEEELSRLGAAFDEMAEELERRDDQLKLTLRQLSDKALSDELTGLPNRRFLWHAMNAELDRSKRRRTPLAVLMFDVDHFKSFNDRWGHEAGDLVLKAVAQTARRVVRSSDVVARFGGEEFVVVLSEANASTAMSRADALRREISALELTYRDKALDRVAISVGVCCAMGGKITADELLRLADMAMYEAKQSGRDRTVLKDLLSGAVPAVD